MIKRTSDRVLNSFAVQLLKTMVLHLIIVATIVSLTACSNDLNIRVPEQKVSELVSEERHLGSTTLYTIFHDGLERNYIVYAPQSYNADGSAAMVMSLHGRPGTNSALMKSQNWLAVADKEGFIVVFPQGSTGKSNTPVLTHWNALNMNTGVDDVGFLKQVLTNVVKKYKTNPARSYVAGFSNGGMMVSRLACEAGETFAALASVAGVGSTAHNDCVPKEVTPIAFIHGEKDELPPQTGRSSNLRPVKETLDVFVNAYNCSSSPIVRKLEDKVKEDGTTTVHYTYDGCKDNATVEYYHIENGGHTWPGSQTNILLGNTSQDFDASEALWRFFASH